MDGRRNVRIDDLSKLTKIDQLREKIQESFEVEPERQRLFYRGKQVCIIIAWAGAYAGTGERVSF